MPKLCLSWSKKGGYSNAFVIYLIVLFVLEVTMTLQETSRPLRMENYCMTVWRILACLVLIKDGDVFFTGIVSAAMENKVCCTCLHSLSQKI